MRGMKRLFAIVTFVGAALIACEKKTEFNPQGNGLPAKYVFIIDSLILTPTNVHLVTGGAVQFVNQTDIKHTLVSDDPTFFSIELLPRMSVLYRPDTIPATTINIPYHCMEHPETQGLITVSP